MSGAAFSVPASSSTSALTWAQRRRRARPWRVPEGPTLVVAPHPDDEILMAGGLIARQRMAGRPVTVIAITDGEAAYPNVHPPALAALRRQEQTAALAELGVDGGTIIRLGVPDSAVAEHLAEVTAAVVAAAPGHDLLIAPWVHDVHADHEAVGQAARRAATMTGIRLLAGLFWGWHNERASVLVDGALRRIDLTEDERRRRRSALLHHRSQITVDVAPAPMLSHADLAPIRWMAEYIIDEEAGSQ